jgi:4-hydroxy-2-oxoheptanedioate aldolase
MWFNNMFKLENEMFDQLCKLKNEYDLIGIKAEFEAEGSSFRDLLRLRRLTSSAGVNLFLKIGGVEALRDIKDALEIGVDGLIAPMVESKFAAKKFFDSITKIYNGTIVHTALTIETKNAVEQFDDILEYSATKFDNITIGRSDLSSSYFDSNIFPDSEFIYEHLLSIGNKIKNTDMTFTVGGSLSSQTLELIKGSKEDLQSLIYKLETRKVILPTDVFVCKKNAINEALKFEELYILSKKDFSDVHIAPEIARLTELKRRLQ